MNSILREDMTDRRDQQVSDYAHYAGMHVRVITVHQRYEYGVVVRASNLNVHLRNSVTGDKLVSVEDITGIDVL